MTRSFPPVSGDALQLMAEFLRIFVVGEPVAPQVPGKMEISLSYFSVDKLIGFSQLLSTLSPVPENLALF